MVFGVQDGLLTTLGLTTGVATATAGAAVAHTTILIAGLAGALAGMISMGTGAYLGATAERDVRSAAIRKERAELASMPVQERAEMVAILSDRGVPQEEAASLADALAKYPRLWEETHIEKELGISADVEASAVRDGVLMACTFLLGAILPILPYVLFSGLQAVLGSLLLSAAGLLGVGLVKAQVVGQKRLLGGLQVLLLGGAAALCAYALGVLLPLAFGLRLPAA